MQSRCSDRQNKPLLGPPVGFRRLTQDSLSVPRESLRSSTSRKFPSPGGPAAALLLWFLLRLLRSACWFLAWPWQAQREASRRGRVPPYRPKMPPKSRAMQASSGGSRRRAAPRRRPAAGASDAGGGAGVGVAPRPSLQQDTTRPPKPTRAPSPNPAPKPAPPRSASGGGAPPLAGPSGPARAVEDATVTSSQPPLPSCSNGSGASGGGVSGSNWLNSRPPAQLGAGGSTVPVEALLKQKTSDLAQKEADFCRQATALEAAQQDMHVARTTIAEQQKAIQDLREELAAVAGSALTAAKQLQEQHRQHAAQHAEQIELAHARALEEKDALLEAAE
eukprot:COSAG01_NODE_15948_length_1281_cov_2.985642_1_plen_333_part_01